MSWKTVLLKPSKLLKPRAEATQSQPPASLRQKPGQSLVETAVILPVLLLMLLGVFEVGWALRAYLVLANVNREAARFAARGVYLDFSDKLDPMTIGYEKVISHTADSLSGQLSMSFEVLNNNAAMMLSYYTAEPTNFNCGAGDPTCANYDCSRFAYENRDQPNFNPGSDLNLVEFPLLLPLPGSTASAPAYYNQSTIGLTNTAVVTSYYYAVGDPDVFSRVDPAQQAAQLRADNNELNCQLLKKGLPTTDSNVLVVENIYFQEQLVGFPIVTSFVPNPVPLYTQTAMQINTDIRDVELDEAENCRLYPLMMPITRFSGGVSAGQVVTITHSAGPTFNNFSFTDWKPGSSSLSASLQDSAAVETFEDAKDSSDGIINVGDWVYTDGTAINSVATELQALANAQTTLNVPTWADSPCTSLPCSTAQASPGAFEVRSFLSVKVKNVDAANNRIAFEFQGTAGNICEGDDRP